MKNKIPDIIPAILIDPVHREHRRVGLRTANIEKSIATILGVASGESPFDRAYAFSDIELVPGVLAITAEYEIVMPVEDQDEILVEVVSRHKPTGIIFLSSVLVVAGERDGAGYRLKPMPIGAEADRIIRSFEFLSYGVDPITMAGG